MSDTILAPKYFLGDIDIAAICNCDLATVWRATGLAMSSGRLPRSWGSAIVRRYKRIGKPHAPNFSDFEHEQLWEWCHLPELKKIVDEYIKTHPPSL